MARMQILKTFFGSFIGDFFGVGILLLVMGLFGFMLYRKIRTRLYGGLFEQEPLRVGFSEGDESLLPAEISKAFRGFMVDLIFVLGKQVGRKVELKDIPKDRAEKALIEKDLDMVIVDQQRTLDESDKVKVIPCHTASLTSLVLIFWDRVPYHIVSLHDFMYYPNNTTVVLKNSLEDHYLALFKGIKTRRVVSLTQLVVDLKLGIVRAGLVRVEYAYFLKREYANIKIMPIALHKQCVIQDERLGLARDNQSLILEVESKMAHLRKNGTVENLYQKWFGNNK